jgi:hypothetical protein
VSALANGGNCLILADQLLRITIANQDNLITPLIKTMDRGAFQELALDMTAFSLLRFLQEKQALFGEMDQEANVYPALKNIAEFAGQFFRSFPGTDLKPICVYCLNRMKHKDLSHEVEILAKVLEQMHGLRELQINLLNDKQLISLAGGMWLKLEMLG